MRARSVVLLLLAGAASSAQPISVPELAPPDMRLIPHGEGARNGSVWVRNLGHSLGIWGIVDGPPPVFAQTKESVLASDHIEVWLAATADVPMPPIGWGNQFDQIELPKGEVSCTDWQKSRSGPNVEVSETECRKWAAAQIRYRSTLKRLFVRQWLLTSDYSIESFATPAYGQIAGRLAPNALKPPQPKLQMTVTVLPGDPGHYRFQIQIPYTDFPPLPALELRDLRLMVDVFSSAPAGKKVGSFSTTSPGRVWGQPGTFNHVQLDPPRVFQMSPCQAGLTGTDMYGDEHPAWFIPRSNQALGMQRDAFILVNYAHGYAYGPDGLSPVVRPVAHFWHSVGPGEWICGPRLAYSKGTTRKLFRETIDQEGLDTKRLSDGTLLIKSGPNVYYSEFGSGQCGACPRVDMGFYGLDKDLNLTEAFALDEIVGGGSMDLSISDDWSTITRFDQEMTADGGAGPWSSTKLCLHGAVYEECGEQPNVRPPDPPLLKELRNE